MNRAMRALQKMKDTPATYVVESINGVQIRNYKNVCMDIGDSQSSDSGAVRAPSARKQAAINRKQFLRSMANNMHSRLYTTMTSKVSIRVAKHRQTGRIPMTSRN